MKQGIYEELVTQLVLRKINELNRDTYFINTSKIDKEEASIIISRHLSRTIKEVLDNVKGDNQIEQQISIANKIIRFLKEVLAGHDFDKDLIETEGEILTAVFSKSQAVTINLMYEIFPLFVIGNNAPNSTFIKSPRSHIPVCVK